MIDTAKAAKRSRVKMDLVFERVVAIGIRRC
jgi:hypothetical protein